MNAAYVDSIIATTQKLAGEGISFAFVSGQSSNIAMNRENIVLDLMNSGYDYDKMIWIDSDISWEPEDFLKLYYSDKDILTGGYISLDGSVPNFKDDKYTEKYFVTDVPVDKIEEITACGFGFLAIKKGIFEVVPRPWFQAEVSGSMVAEDVAFCHNARKMGYHIFFDTSIRVNHHKEMVLGWNGLRPN